ncbi:MAG TPA: hypothetical protein VFE51_06025 [Verrucomicrobiae bacterium]|nr:hypothetical protein [Verrucomicrobiae bacterium]
MKRVMLDHFRRWWWVLALTGLLEFWVGRLIANRPQDPFEFWALLVSLWAGANLLSFDFKRGLLRPVSTLPLTARQVGRSWWLATVPLPAIGLTALLFLGAGTFCHLHPEKALPTTHLALGSLFTLVWLGSGFPMIFGATRGLGGSPWRVTWNFFLSALGILMLFGSMLLAQGASNSPIKCVVLLGVGGFLTVVGWVDAERFDVGRGVQFYRGRPEPPNLGRHRFQLTPLESKVSENQTPAEAGYGGVWFFVLSRVIRMFWIIAATSALTALLWAWRGSPMAGHSGVVLFAGSGSLMSFGFMIVFQLLPALRHLRLLRTMPISGIGLSAALMAIMLLPLIALGAASAAVAAIVFDPPSALTFLSDYTFALAPASLCVVLLVWLGDGKLSYALLILIFFGSQQVQLRLQSLLHVLELPVSLAAAIAAACVLLALPLTLLALRSSRLAYRERAITPGSFPFGVGA